MSTTKVFHFQPHKNLSQNQYHHKLHKNIAPVACKSTFQFRHISNKVLPHCCKIAPQFDRDVYPETVKTPNKNTKRKSRVPREYASDGPELRKLSSKLFALRLKLKSGQRTSGPLQGDSGLASLRPSFAPHYGPRFVVDLIVFPSHIVNQSDTEISISFADSSLCLIIVNLDYKCRRITILVISLFPK